MSILQLTLPLTSLRINIWLFKPCSPRLTYSCMSQHTRMETYSWHNLPTDSTEITFYITFTLSLLLQQNSSKTRQKQQSRQRQWRIFCAHDDPDELDKRRPRQIHVSCDDNPRQCHQYIVERHHHNRRLPR